MNLHINNYIYIYITIYFINLGWGWLSVISIKYNTYTLPSYYIKPILEIADKMESYFNIKGLVPFCSPIYGKKLKW